MEIMGVKMQQGGHKEKNNGIENVCSGSISQFLAGLHLSDVKTAKQGHLCDWYAEHEPPIHNT